MNAGDELKRHLVIVALAAPGAAIVWWIFHGVYVNLSEAAQAVGYIDANTQTGIDLGYAFMVGGTLLLAAIAVRSAFICIRMLVTRAQ